ncbi:MAG: hypothetical protein ABH821_02625 [archaeon]
MKKFFLFLVFLLFLSSLVSANFKDESLFCDDSVREAFLVSDKYWQEVLMLNPVVFKNNGSLAGPLFIFHEEDGAFDVDAIINFLQKFELERVTILYDPDTENGVLDCNPETMPQGREAIYCNLISVLKANLPFGAGLSNEDQIQIVFPSRLIDYWSEIDTVVLVENNYELALTASVFAAKNNYPLFVGTVIESENFSVEGKNVFLVGNVSCPAGATCDSSFATLKDLQDNLLSSFPEMNENVIIVNPNDVLPSYADNESFQTEKSSNPIQNLYYKHSLLAPFLAAARNEFILFLPQTLSSEDSECNGNITSNAFKARELIMQKLNAIFGSNWPENYTILASPSLLPDSICAGNKDNYSFRHQFDSFYFNKNPFVGDTLSHSVAFDSTGNIVLAYSNVKANLITQFGTELIFYTKLNSSGERLFEDKLIGFSSGQVSNAFVLVDSSDNSIVFWEDSYDNRIHASLISSSNEVLIDNQSLGIEGKNFSAVISENNEIYLVYSDLTETKLLFSKVSFNNDSFSSNVPVAFLDVAGEDIISFPFLSFNFDKSKLGLTYFIKDESLAREEFVWLNFDGGVEVVEPFEISSNVSLSPNNFLVDSADNLYFVFVSGDKLFFKSFSVEGTEINSVELDSLPESLQLINPFLETVFFSDQVIWVFYGDGMGTINQMEVSIAGGILSQQKGFIKNSSFMQTKKPLILKDNESLFLFWLSLINRGDDSFKFEENDLFFKRFTSPDWSETLKLSLDLDVGAKWGRIYSLTTSDVSSYINLSLYYNFLLAKLYENSQFNAASIAHSFIITKDNAIAVKNKVGLVNGSECFIRENSYEPNPRLREGTDDFCVNNDYPTINDLRHRNIITFGDHATETAWVDAIDFMNPHYNNGVTWFDLSFVATQACLTSHFPFKDDFTRFNVAPNLLRRGAVTYFGATGINYYFPIFALNWFDYGPEVKAVNYLLSSKNPSLGEINRDLYLASIENIASNYSTFAPIYEMLGDPLLVFEKPSGFKEFGE